MLPVYIVGNLHCLGMCGPIAALIAASPFRGYYLLGRLSSFTLAGTLAGAFGYVVQAVLEPYRLTSLFSIVLGGAMVVSGTFILMGKSFGLKQFKYYEEKMAVLLMKKGPFALFAFGFLTIALPCGQTVLVYSACALSGSAIIGTLNGMAFALITTPSLLLAMQARHFVKAAHHLYRPVMGLSGVIVGGVAVYRGLFAGGWV